MSLIDSIKNLFRKGGAKVGVIKSLTNITDDDRISISPDEYIRISEAKRYYRNDFPKVKYRNSYGRECERRLSSLNITKMAARRLASVIFNEQCSVAVNNKESVSNGDDDTAVKNDKAHELIDEVLADNDFYTTYEEQLEQGIALGGFTIRPYVENDKIKLSWIKADQFYPLQSNVTEINEAAIADKTTVQDGNKNLYYTLLEFHQWIPAKEGSYNYQITNELYESEDKGQIGVNVPLDKLPKYKGLQPISVLSGLETPLFAYFKTPGANNISPESPLGLGIIDNAKHTVDAVNMTHDQFVHEVEIGKRRIAVPSEMLRPGGPMASRNGQQEMHPPMFDKSTDIYEAMYGDPQMKITDLTQPIRNVQYQATMSFFMREFENETGLSQGTFTADGEGVKTATEVVSNNSMTYQTRSSYLTQVDKQIKALVRAILYTASNGALFSNGIPLWTGDVDSTETIVDFNDGVFVDQEAQFNKDMQAVDDGMMPRVQFLVRNYQLDEKTAKEWMEQANEESTERTPDALQESALFGGGGTDDEEDNDEPDESSGQQDS